MNTDPRSITDIDLAIGARLRERRQELKLSMAYVAEAIGISFQQLQKYESGQNRVAAATLVSLAEVLRIEPTALLSHAKPPAKRAAPTEDAMARQLQQAFSKLTSQRERRLILDLTRRLAAAQAKPAEKKRAPKRR
jgi:transcriptional regulator with XRE-family HTH domain